jgi:serine/threonine protein kinase
MKSEVGTYQYMSIQQLKRTQYSNKCDIWALGLIFYQMLHGEMPWVAQTNYDLIKKMETINLTIKRKDLSAATKNFIEKCLKL